jgi:hypothetical protein
MSREVGKRAACGKRLKREQPERPAPGMSASLTCGPIDAAWHEPSAAIVVTTPSRIMFQLTSYFVSITSADTTLPKRPELRPAQEHLKT